MDSILGTPSGSILAVDGIGLADLRVLCEACEPAQDSPTLLFLPLPPRRTSTAMVEDVVARLAEIALKLWPIWLGSEPLPHAGTDRLGRMAVAAAARRLARQVGGMLLPWAEAAALQALEGRVPRVPATAQAVELAQLARLVAPGRLILATEVPSDLDTVSASAMVHALEWIARHMHGAVIAVFPDPPARDTPFDRIRFGARHFIRVDPVVDDEATEDGQSPPAEPWLLPWRGRPHPLSAIEQRMARLLSADADLGPLFLFNQVIATTRGSRPRVDLLWPAGRLVVELDGYADHGTRSAFMRDRQRDFELVLSGYTVLRLANEEVAQDCARALEKIRDLVQHRKQVLPQEE